MHTPLSLLLTTVAVFAGSAPPPSVLRVGTTQAYATIQAAVDAANTGDLILVDPGSYPAFTIDGKAIAVVASNDAFTVLQTAGTPAITVRSIALSETATVVGAHIDYEQPSAPAVRVIDNDGAVRFSVLHIEPTADLLGAAAQAVIEVSSTGTFWLINSNVWTTSPKRAYTINPHGPNDGVSALQMDDSDGVVQNCKLLGYNNKVAVGTGLYAGDGLRVLGNSSVSLFDDYVASPTGTRLRGGNGGQYGGNGLHLLGNPANKSLLHACGRVKLDYGTGTTLNGGSFAINNDGGIVQQNGNITVFRILVPCVDWQLAETSVASALAPSGGTVEVRIYTALARSFVTQLALGSVYARSVSGFAGIGMLDPTAPYDVTVQTGTTTAQNGQTFSVQIPDLPEMIGWQMTFQSAIGPSATNYNALSMPSLIVITPVTGTAERHSMAA